MFTGGDNLKTSCTAERLKYLMNDRNLRQVDILKLCEPYCQQYDVKMNKSDLSQYLAGKNEPNQDKLAILSMALNVNESWLMGYDVVMERASTKEMELFEKEKIKHIETQKVPLIGTIAAGQPIFADENFECYVEIGTNIKCDYCLRVKGDSMINARIYDGDLVFIRKQPDVHEGEIAAVLIEDEVTLKRVYKGHDYIKLVAENPKYEPIIVSKSDYLNVIILGKAVTFQSNII